MFKNQMKRSEYIFVTLTDTSTKAVTVEGDEVYLTVANSNDNTLKIRRETGRQFASEVAANAGFLIESGYLSEWETANFASGKISLDVPATSTGLLTNAPVTTASGNVATVERIRNAAVGIKEKFELKATNTTYPLNVVIEVVNYVPVDVLDA